ncbi:MAG: thiamine diphosphokinase [Clostridia bacterium]|nr:thiamine diphosphokinase [Clostridia bacterium]
MNGEKSRAVIMAGADISDYSFFTPLSGDYVICADRGYLHAKTLGISPDILLGDFDSLDIPLPENTEKIIFPAEKDETDLQIAISHAMSQGFEEVYVIGATGGRTDHFLGNIALLHWAKKRGCRVILEDADTHIQLLSGALTLQRRTDFYLSLIPFAGDAVVSVSGVKYPLAHAVLPLGDTLGISNEITADEASITVHHGEVLVLQCRTDKHL